MHKMIENPFDSQGMILYVFYDPDKLNWDEAEKTALREVSPSVNEKHVTVFRVPYGFKIKPLKREKRDVELVAHTNARETLKGALKRKQERLSI